MRLLETANWSPSAGNRQPWEFVIVTDPQGRERLSTAALRQQFVAQAPVIVVVCANLPWSAERYGERGTTLYAIQDCASATMLLLLAATNEGLATCWVGAFDENAVSKELNLPEHVRPVALVPIGYPETDRGRTTQRIPITEKIHEETYSSFL